MQEPAQRLQSRAQMLIVGDVGIQPALLLIVRAAARAFREPWREIVERGDDGIGSHVGKPEGAHPGGVDDPSALGESQHQGRG